MDLLHVALAASSEDRADRFYAGLLGLQKAQPRSLPAEIGRALFGIDRELTIVNYTGPAAHFEVFIPSAAGASAPRVEHTCLAVESLPEFLSKCEQLQFEILRVPKGASVITFVKDADGNLFEMKEKSG